MEPLSLEGVGPHTLLTVVIAVVIMGNLPHRNISCELVNPNRLLTVINKSRQIKKMSLSK